MKKVLFMALAAAAMVSCSNDELVELNQEAIAFGDNFVENSTRAIDPSYGTEALTQFNVWGSVIGDEGAVTVFENDNVEGTVGSTDGEVNIWECTTRTQYWIAGVDYYFAAIVNGKDCTITLDELLLPYKISGFNSNGTTDLLYATTGTSAITGKESGNDPVDFTFNHMLARAQFTVTNTTNKNSEEVSGYYYKVSGVQMNNAFTKGDCTLFGDSGECSWDNHSEATTIAFGNVTNVDDKAKETTDTAAIAIADRATATTHYWRMLVPYAYAITTTDNTTDDFSVTFTVELYAPGGVLVTKETVTREVAVEFVAGHSYNFNIEVGIGQPIQFSVKENPTWGETETGGTITY